MHNDQTELSESSVILWARRNWLIRSVSLVFVSAHGLHWRNNTSRIIASSQKNTLVGNAIDLDRQATHIVDDWPILAQSGVDAAMHAGAQYADARLTHVVQHGYSFEGMRQAEQQTLGVGVRALVNGYWGFAACPSGDTIAIEQLARDAVDQAKMNARGAPRTVTLSERPPAIGSWSTPVKIDPFTIPVEEKTAFLDYWDRCAAALGLLIFHQVSGINFKRERRVIATSDGSHFTQTLFESGGFIKFGGRAPRPLAAACVRGIETAGRGWEMFLDANIPEQFEKLIPEMEAKFPLEQTEKPMHIGRYTVVCDGAIMSAMLGATLGMATQLDRALGYEANAGGTSFLNDPLGMLGSFKVASPMVTVTANRSTPVQLATVKWDDEGVSPAKTTLVKDGILNDFQTTREQAAWLAPYYQKIGRPISSNGYAAAEDASSITMQHMPNLAMEPSPSPATLEDLVANVKDGILVERDPAAEIDRYVWRVDSQASSGAFQGVMREIKNGRLGQRLDGGVFLFNSLNFWRDIIAIGGPSTQREISAPQYSWEFPYVKGQPSQRNSHSIQAVAATIPGQALINPQSLR